MPPSMRRQSLSIKKGLMKREDQAQKRSRALRLLKAKKGSIRTIADLSGVPRSTVCDLKSFWEKGDSAALEKMLSADTKRGGGTVLTAEEEKIVVERLSFVASRGAALGYDALRCMMAKIASDGRKGFANAVPSNETLRSFRARHRELTFRSQENKEASKINAEKESHVRPFFDLLAEIGEKHPGILSNPNRLWNLDETAVDATFGKKEKLFAPSTSHHGGYRSCSTNYASQKHITAVVCVSASGLKTPPFFIVQGKRINERWFDAVLGSFAQTLSGTCGRYTASGWFPSKSAVVKVTDRGSMEMDVLQAAVKHISNFIADVVGDQTVLLTLDGHSSRNGTGWVDECRENNIEAVIAPANTSHFLQPCDQAVNKRFKGAMRNLRDAFCAAGIVDTRKVNFNLACGVHAYEQISTEDITKSFEKTGLFPFQPDFAQQFRTIGDDVRATAVSLKERVVNAGVQTRLNSVVKRRTDVETYQQLTKIFSSALGPSTAIQRMSCVLKQAETINSIIMSEGSARTASTVVSGSKPTELHHPGAPTECVTLDEVRARRAAEQALREREEANKVRRQEEQANERQKRKEEAERKQHLATIEREKKRALAVEYKERMELERQKKRKQREARQARERSLKQERRLRVQKDRELVVRLSREVAAACSSEAGVAATRGTSRQKAGRGRKRRSLRSCYFIAGIVVEAIKVATES